MTKSKTNALDALRALIAERQQYDEWISTLESKRVGTAEQVFTRVYSDYRSRLDRVVEEIRSHSEELQLSITTLSARLGEVAKEEQAKRESMQEAELRAAVGEYDVAQWESMRADANRQLEKAAADRSALESQLGELESIRKLSEVAAPSVDAGAATVRSSNTATLQPSQPSQPAREQPTPHSATTSNAGWPSRESDSRPQAPAHSEQPQRSTPSAPTQAPLSAAQPAATPTHGLPTAGQLAAQAIRARVDPSAASPRPSATPVSSPPVPTPPRRKAQTPTGKDAQISAGFSKPLATPPDARPEVNKTLKCPECGTANYPTEWYCERCGGELATV